LKFNYVFLVSQYEKQVMYKNNINIDKTVVNTHYIKYILF